MKLGIMTIATNRYIHYFESLVDSFLEIYPNGDDVEWFLFTDQTEEAARQVSERKKIKITVIPIQGYLFPQATLYRYAIYNLHQDKLDSEVLMHLDADMLIKSKDFLPSIFSPDTSHKVSLVSHPGFYRSKGFVLLKFYFLNPKYLARDLVLKVKMGSLGSWETNKDSLAYVRRSDRKNYVCGGIWFGPNVLIKEMSGTLAIRVNQDESRNIMAKWHDESHLNHFAAQSDVNVLSPELCFDPSYKNLDGLRELVRAVDKNA
jgi:hypothetical protein